MVNFIKEYKKGFARKERARYENPMTKKIPKGFNDHPYPYHHELELKIERVSNLGLGIARDNGWVIQVPFVLPGELVRVRIYRNHKNYSDADCMEILIPSSDRVEAKCELFGTCGGCQYQMADYSKQLEWKRNQVSDCFQRIGGLELTVLPTIPSPKIYGYRSKLTPHYQKTKDGIEPKLGFLKNGSRKILIDVPKCPIATDSINRHLQLVRKELFKERKRRGGTLLLRDVQEGVTTDPNQLVTEKVESFLFQFKAGEFFQNNPYILPGLVEHVIEQAAPKESLSLIDAFCGGGLFSLFGSMKFEKVVGIEISREGFEGARTNAKLNQISNAEFFLGDASSIFEELKSLPNPCSLVVDPPRKGCDSNFLNQCLEFQPKRIIYVSCDPATQARDAKILVDGGYEILQVQPFDLFPQTRHIENVLTLKI